MKERDIHSVLSSFQKPVLEDICYLLGSETSFRLKKRDMVSSLSDYLHRKPRRWLDCLMERDLLLLKALVNGGPEKVQYMEIGHYHSLLEISGLIDVQDDGGRFQQVTLSREVYDIVAPYLDEAIEKGNKSGRFEFERAALGFLNIYGMVPVPQFLDFVQDWCDAGYGPGIKRLLVLVQDSPLIKMCRFTDEYGDYLTTPCMDNLPKMLEERAGYGFKEGELKPLDAVEEAMLAGNGAPFFTVGMESAAGLELTDMLRRIGFEEGDMRRIVHEIWLDAQSEDVGDMIYNAVYAKDEFIRSDAEFKRCLQIVADYANSIPLWRLCGFSAKEQNLEIFYIPEDYLAAPEYPEEADDAEDHPHWTMPKPSVSEGYDTSAKDLQSELQKFIPGGFSFGLAVPHVAPDDACPCGSGLRYKNCHGKMMN